MKYADNADVSPRPVSKNHAAEEVAEVHNAWRKKVEELQAKLASVNEERDYVQAMIRTYKSALNCDLYPSEKPDVAVNTSREREHGAY